MLYVPQVGDARIKARDYAALLKHE